jgi:colanic acid/amylovoran biosynthesis protein
MIRFLLIGNANCANRGCAAIDASTLEILSRRFPGSGFMLCPFSHPQGPHYDSSNKWSYDVQTKYIASLKSPWSPKLVMFAVVTLLNQKLGTYLRIRHILREADEYICSLQLGGDNYSLDYEVPAKRIAMDELLMQRGVPVVLWGASVGPFSAHPAFERRMAMHLKRLALICARESLTVEYLKSIGVEANVRQVADPAFTLPEKEPVLPDYISRILDRRPLGINLSPLMVNYLKIGYASWSRTASEHIASFLDSGTDNVILVPHVMQPGNNDWSFLADVAKQLASYGDRVALAPDNLNASEYKWVIARCRAFVGARTHATIAAYSSCVPVISIGYSLKARGISRDIYGSEEWNIPVKQLNSDLLCSKVSALLASEDNLRSYLSGMMPEYKARAYAAADYLAEVLRNR